MIQVWDLGTRRRFPRTCNNPQNLERSYYIPAHPFEGLRKNLFLSWILPWSGWDAFPGSILSKSGCQLQESTIDWNKQLNNKVRWTYYPSMKYRLNSDFVLERKSSLSIPGFVFENQGSCTHDFCVNFSFADPRFFNHDENSAQMTRRWATEMLN